MNLVTYQGISFDYLEPKVEMININDIIYSLSRLNRFVGHSKRAYSVAEHSYLCYVMAEKLGFSIREQLLVLIHDFTEAYVGDCPSPLKKFIPEFSVIEERIEKVIYEYVGIAPPTEEEYEKIKLCDITMLAIEMRDLTNHNFLEFLEDASTEIFEDGSFLISDGYVSEKMYREKLLETYTKLLHLGASGFSKYKITFGLKDREETTILFEHHSDFESAYNTAYQYARELYYTNPNNDILEIVESYGVDEEVAYSLFEYEMSKYIEFYAVKVEE